MKRCWPDGDLRAYLDGELPAETLAGIALHLKVCAACGERYREVSERAAMVYGAMAGLFPDAPVIPAPVPAAPAIPSPSLVAHAPSRWRLCLAALPVAAALAIALVGMPKSPPPVTAAPAQGEFVRLDDEPLEAGVVVHISAENGDVEADLILGPDGRPRAIRMTSTQ